MLPFRFQLTARSRPLTVEDYRERARRALPKMVWAFVDGGAERELTLRANQTAFDQWWLTPRMLTNGNGADLSTTVAGTEVALPVVPSPTGMTGLIHWEGERAIARAAESLGTRSIVSSASSYTVEEIGEATEHNHFFQLYPWTSQRTGEPLAEQFIGRARAAGFSALFVTVDVPVPGNRLNERREGMAVPPILTPWRALDVAAHPRWAYGFLKHKRVAGKMLVSERGATGAVKSAKVQQRLLTTGIDWSDLQKIRDLWAGPMYIKGILHPDDAAQAVAMGADGIVVSNHGGRQLDGAVSALDAMVEVVDRVGKQVPVLLDGGVRSGTDVVKAIALGATAVTIGRAQIYGLAAAGQRGVADVLSILRDEITRTLTLMGLSSIKELDRSHVQRQPR